MHRPLSLMGRLLLFSAIPFGAFLVLWLAFAFVSLESAFALYMFLYFVLPYTLFPIGDALFDSVYLWLMTFTASVLHAGLTTTLSRHRSTAAASAIYAGLTFPISIIIHALVMVSGNPWGLLLIG